MYEATGTRELYQPIQSCHVICLGISNKSVAVPRQDSIHPCCRAHAVLSGYCNIVYMYVHTLYMYAYVTVLVVKGFALLKLLTDTWALIYSSNYDHTNR